jgi:ABC-type dipeptide/oligopeptide/nickel transport system permease subunit
MMLSDACNSLFTEWQLSIYPGVAIMLTVLGDAFDRRLG